MLITRRIIYTLYYKEDQLIKNNIINYEFNKNIRLILNFRKTFSVGQLNPAIHGIRVASVIAFSVCLYVLLFSNPICYKFSNSTPA